MDIDLVEFLAETLQQNDQFLQQQQAERPDTPLPKLDKELVPMVPNHGYNQTDETAGLPTAVMPRTRPFIRDLDYFKRMGFEIVRRTLVMIVTMTTFLEHYAWGPQIGHGE